MTTLHLNILKEHLEYRTLLSDGVYLTDRETEEGRSFLFELNGTYIEVCFNKLGDRILKGRQLEQLEQLDPYLQEIDLTPVL